MSEGRLPNLLVIGVPKAGTGSLYGYLSQHPDICASDEKEVGYFNYFNPARNQGPPPPLSDYRRHFAHCTGARYAFEATPTYSYGGRPVIDAIAATLDRPRIVLSLRNPVDRLWSAYTFQRELGNMTRYPRFEDYLEACERRSPDGSDLVPRDHLHGLYIGHYANYVPHWLDAFGSDLHVIFAERFRSDPHAVVAGICRWLGIDDAVVRRLDLQPRNTTQHPRSTRAAHLAYSVKRAAERRGLLPPRLKSSLRGVYQKANAGAPPEAMSDEVRRHVEELYRSSNEVTAQALLAHGYADLPTWLRVSAGSS
ncbi:sulfotransferase family protein [Nocardioides caldifontis]|uniref:sulfotransferase family protein n=1 Tax=Nocardioides caldifontis TaxID=2588938 RepID=UPI0011E01407|nr:sulfotransferase [Nocardioides caldifontis]